jgi:SecD/SecF fusion protein
MRQDARMSATTGRTLDLALQAFGCDQVHVVHKPRLPSDNGSSYVSGDLAEWLQGKGMKHSRGAPYHPQTEGNEALIRIQGEVGQATVAAVERAATNVIPEAVFDQIDLVGPTISGELATTGLLALGLAVLAMLAYIWVRFEWHFAAGAIAVLFLDVTKTFGVIALMGWEVNLTTIVALLTLIGYSVNDKVVVYDRIREHLVEGSDEPLADVIDRSLNQVLARCIFTSGTTLAAILPMAIWGGPAVSGFAWPMTAGVIIATASSLFVAGPVLVWLAKRDKGATMPTVLRNQA